MNSSPGTLNIEALNVLKESMQKIKQQRSTTKAQIKQLEEHAINHLMSLGVRYVDESGIGEGPFWVLGKTKTDGGWNRARYQEFFSKLLAEIAQGVQFTPAQLGDLAQEYLKQFEKRTLTINKLSQCRLKTTDDLQTWLHK
jgi:ferritin